MYEVVVSCYQWCCIDECDVKRLQRFEERRCVVAGTTETANEPARQFSLVR